MSRWKAFRHRLERRGVAALAWFIPRLSRSQCVKLGVLLGDAACALDARGRAVAHANLECVFGPMPAAQRRELVRASYRNFVRTMLDLFWAQNLTAENHAQYLRLEGFEALRERHAQSRGGSILFCVHQGNWEWASLAVGFAGLATQIVAENFKNPLLTPIFNRLRERSGNQIIAQENSMLRLLKVVKRGGTTGLLLDLNLRPTQAATVIEAFGAPGLEMCVTFLHALLAQRAGTLLFPVETQPQADGTCRVIAHPPVEWPAGASVREIAQRCWNAMEPIVRARPGEWLWPYKHFRYRPRATAREYPFYAHASARFEKLRATAAK